MKNSFSKTILALSIACGLALQISAPSWVNAEEKTSTGVNGATGTNGANGNPGQDGTAGQDGGSANAVTLTGNARSSAFGGKGGVGGKGGNGVGVGADGGQGGNGGKGGGAEASATTSETGATAFARALGGAGGNGGSGGTPSAGAIPGFGGTGGGGGVAVAEASGVRAATAIAVGGASGVSGGLPFSNSFAGGSAQAKASAVNTAGAVTVIARQFGGHGGNSGGNGANSALNNSVVGQASTNLVFEQNARGGNGGNGLDGVGGNGGYAFSGFDTTTLSSNGSMSGTILALAGHGGNSGQAPYSAGNGGNSGVSFFSNNRVQNISTRGVGGNGGNHFTGSLGGNGGNAYQDQSQSILTNGSELDFRTTLNGGHGGSSFANAKIGYGNGGSASAVDSLILNDSAASFGANSIRLVTNLSGGNAGAFGDVNDKDRYVGLAGTATARFDDSAGALSKFIRVNAQGGKGADFVKHDPFSTLNWAGGNGGRAEIDISSVNAKGSVTIEANARGGDIGNGGDQLISPLGFLGFGGQAYAKGYGSSSAANQTVSVTAKSQGGRGLDLPTLNGGGGSRSFATAEGTSNNTVIANAFSKAINSSDISLASAVSSSASGNATANSGADGGAAEGLLDVLGSQANASSEATTTTGSAVANASAVAGNLQRSISSATANGRQANATASSKGGNSQWSLDGMRGGNASAFARSNSGNGLGETLTEAKAFATAGNLIVGVPAVSGIGGYSQADAIALSDSTVGGVVKTLAVSQGGLGSNFALAEGRDGRADASAISTLNGQLGMTEAVAQSKSTYFGNSLARAVGGQTATAVAEVSLGGGGYSQAFSKSSNDSQAMSQSTARFVGPSTTLGAQRGTVRAEAESQGASVNSAKVAVSGIVDAFDGSITQFGAAQAALGHHQSTDVLGIVLENSSAFSHYQIAPTNDLVNAVLGDNASVLDEFDTVYGFGLLGNSVGLETAFRSKFDLDMDLISAGDQFKVGFFDRSWSGTGFDTFRLKISIEGNLVIDETFLNVGAADTFFADQVIGIGDVANIFGPLNFEVEWLMNTNANSSFMGGIVFGTTDLPPSFISSVPEPGTWSLLFLSACGLGFTRRRRN